VEGGLRKEKSEVLEGFKEVVEARVRKWEQRKKVEKGKEMVGKQRGKDDEEKKMRTQAQWDEKIKALEKSVGFNDWKGKGKGKGKDSGKADNRMGQGGKKKVSLEEFEEIDDYL
jgi:hypothetical protein